MADMKATIIEQYITRNPYFNDGKWIYAVDLKGFMLHSVGVGQPDPWVFIRSWDDPGYTNAGVNGFIGADATYLTAPCLETASRVKRMPHGGKRWVNDHYIGFEMTEPAEIKYTGGDRFTISNLAAAQNHAKKTYANAVDLFAKLCVLHGKDPLKPGVIISHNEGGKQGIATGHTDPEHLWKGLKLPYTMDGFRKDVKNKIHEEDYMTKEQILKELGDQYIERFEDLPEWAKPEVRPLLDQGFIKGTSATDPDDIGMFMSDIRTLIVCARIAAK